MTAREIWEQRQVDNGRIQFIATALVLQHLAQYSHYHDHKRRIMAILTARQYGG